MGQYECKVKIINNKIYDSEKAWHNQTDIIRRKYSKYNVISTVIINNSLCQVINFTTQTQNISEDKLKVINL